MSGASARLIGLLGLAATGILAANAYVIGQQNLVAVALMAVTALFCFVKSGQFLLPRVHALTLTRTVRALPRLIFIAISLAWLLVSAYIVLDYARTIGFWPASPFARALDLGIVCLLFLFVFFFMWGAGYRAAAARGLMATPVQSDEPEVEYFARSPMTADAPPPRQLPKRYEMVSSMDQNGPMLRRRDVWDYYAAVMILVAILGGYYAFRFSTTVQSAEFDRIIDANMLFVFGAVTAAFSAPLFLFSVLRPASTPALARMGYFRKSLLALFATPFIGALLTLVVPFDLVPHAWNAVTPNEPETILYQVVSIEETGRVRDCIRIKPVETPDTEMLTCGLGADLAASIRPGTTLEATGELSFFGHTLESVQILP
ncbi:MAG: hypothetical protein AAGC82_16925 [Pseudomonadota bacterium]